jgi:hypothetical protein
MLRVIMENEGGELESLRAEDGRDAARVLAQLAKDCGELAAGDVFRIIEVEPREQNQ